MVGKNQVLRTFHTSSHPVYPEARFLVMAD